MSDPAVHKHDYQAWRAPHFIHGEDGQLACNGEPPLLTREQQEAAAKKAYEEGLLRGYQDGLAQAEAEVAQSLSQFEAMMRALQQPLEALDETVVDELVQLCMAVVRQMVRRELKISPGEIVAVVRETLQLLPVANGDVKVELHPDDARLVREAMQRAGSEASWQIIEDPVLSRGGCRVLSKTSRIDATVENRLNAAIAAVMGGERVVD